MNYNNNNNFFVIDNRYFIYIYLVNKTYTYSIEYINNILYLICPNKNTNKLDTFKLKIMYDKRECLLEYPNQQTNIIKIGNPEDLPYEDAIDLTKLIKMNNYYIYEIKRREIDDEIKYIINNDVLIVKDVKAFKGVHLLIVDETLLKQYDIIIKRGNTIIPDLKSLVINDIININNDAVTDYHWYFNGKYNSYLYFIHLIEKYKDLILKLNYDKIQWSADKKNTLLFIDTRYDKVFMYLLILFVYSVDMAWNITIYTTPEHKGSYLADMEKLGLSGSIRMLSRDIQNISDYSNMLRDGSFWEEIKEDNCLLFQYDSFCMGKFDKIFFDYPYIGALWFNDSSIISDNVVIGNGGTSFRKTRIMEYLCKKYSDKDIKKNYPEDLFFAELLYEERMNNCPVDIAGRFSFENIFNDNSVYGHQIYKSIDIDKLDDFIYRKLNIDIYI